MAEETKNNLTKAKEAKETKEKYMLSQNDILNSKQLLQILQKTPQKYIYTRPGRGGKTFTYVKGQYIKKVLNFVFGWQWDFQIKEHGKEGNQLWVLGTLTIRDKKGNQRIVKEQFGRAEIKVLKAGGNVDFGNDLKAAATDALKKCASELGIASDVYNSEEDKEAEDHIVPDIPTKPKQAVRPPLGQTIDGIRRTRDLKTLQIQRKRVEEDKALYNEVQKRILLQNIDDQIDLCSHPENS